MNPSFTHLSNFIDLFSESNLFELVTNERVMLMELILPQDFIEKHTPRRIPQKIPRSFMNNFMEENLSAFPGVVSVTCKKSPFVFEYVDFDLDLEYLDN
ncbi:MAG: hypothetical protein IJQ68_06580 [Methanobrevibacter sp.]|uniref:hypothetical protein n=1 Tax=Methanobrevibacter sp. TaxID=66852 RepID=UPI0025D4A343|nr:hypothetical protein [Methanobrevibacter sp.]MBR0271637.1 hypothetical protein [Methanobrevibacter sp.]